MLTSTQAPPMGGDVPSVGSHIVLRGELFERLVSARRVVMLSAPAGSGKTVLLRTWIHEMRLTDRAALVSLRQRGVNAQSFWISVVEAIRGTAVGSTVVRALTPPVQLDSEAIVERLVADLAVLDSPLWLVVDDLELCPVETFPELQRLLMCATDHLRVVLSGRHDLPIGLYRLRLDGELTEIRATHLSFTVPEASMLFERIGVRVSQRSLVQLVERTEGWAAGLSLAAHSLASHPDQDTYVDEFSGSDQVVAEYLLGEVFNNQSVDVRDLLLRTSILDRVSGRLANFLTGRNDGERILQDLEDANLFVVALDTRRTWFRYHRLFADLLRHQLRRTAPDETTALHNAAAQWHIENGYPIEAVRHAQAGFDWTLASRVLSDNGVWLLLSGQATILHELLSEFPPCTLLTDPELAALAAADALTGGALEEAERYLAAAALESHRAAAGRRGRLQVTLSALQLQLARQRNNRPTTAEETGLVLVRGDATQAVLVQLGADLRSLALVNSAKAIATVLPSGPEVEIPPDLRLAQALLVRAIARDASGHALEGALDVAELDRLPLRFLLERGLPGRNHWPRAIDAPLASNILSFIDEGTWTMRSAPLAEPLTRSELRILPYLQTNLTQPEIAAELGVSPNTVNTHISHVYRKFGAHCRREAVEGARRLGMLAPTASWI